MLPGAQTRTEIRAASWMDICGLAGRAMEENPGEQPLLKELAIIDLPVFPESQEILIPI